MTPQCVANKSYYGLIKSGDKASFQELNVFKVVKLCKRFKGPLRVIKLNLLDYLDIVGKKLLLADKSF